MGRTCAIFATFLASLLTAAPAAAEPTAAEPVAYRAPVPGPIVDPYRPPSTPYGPGNRGIDYATTPGEPVTAPADGVVTFAGAVGGGLHVVLLHRDGIRTSLSFLAVVLVTRGQQVSAGQTVGRAGARLHFGARRGEVYLDPATLFGPGGGGGARSVLVPEGPGRVLGAEEEAAGLRRLLAAVAPSGLQPAVVGLADAARTVARLEVLVGSAVAAGAPPAWAVLAAASTVLAQAGLCTPAAVPAPPRPPGSRVLVLVAGLGSSSASAAVSGLDVGTLGYGPIEVVRFSYRTGTTSEVPYDAGDTLDGIGRPAERLAALLGSLAAAHPGQPLDIVAHSMGGLVARAALAAAPFGRPPAPVTLVTLGTPHAGADVAAVGRLWAATTTGRLAVEAAALTSRDVVPASRSVADLAPGSAFLTRLAAMRPPDPPIRIAAIGARTDVIVPASRARWPGAPSTTVDVEGAGALAHDALPRSPAATREVALAIAGAPPTCRSPADALVDAAVSLAVQAGTYGLGVTAAAGMEAALPIRPIPLGAIAPGG